MAVQVRVRLGKSYLWLTPVVGQLTALVREYVMPFVGSEAKPSLSIETALPRQEKSFDTIEEWIEELPNAQESIHFSASKDRHGVSLWLYPAQHRGSVDITTTVEREPEAKVLLGNIIKTLGLVEERQDDSGLVRLEGEYRVAGFENTALIATINKLSGEFGGIVSFGGEVRMLAASERRYNFRNLEQWKSRVENSWKEIAGATYWLRMASGSASISYQKDRQILRLSLEAPETTKLDGAFNSFVQSLNAIPVRDGGNFESMKGERRRYFPETPVDTEWFQQCLSINTSWNTGQTSFQGRIRTSAQELTMRDFGEWKKEIFARWREIQSIYAWFSSFELTQTLEVDLLREIVSVEIQGRTTNIVNANFNSFESTLKLKRFYGNPYQYRKFARTYKIEEWKTEAAAPDAILEAVASAFGNKSPAITNAYITIGTKAEDLQPCSSISEFTGRLRKGEYATARLTLEGPRGIGLGILVDRSRKRLSIRSSLERNEFEKVVRKFQDRIDLELDVIEDDPEKSSKADKPSAVTTWVPILVAVLTGAVSISVALFTSASGLPSLKTTLQITAPKTDKEIGEVVGTKVPFQWVIAKKTLFAGEQPEEKDATIIVNEEGGTGYRTEYHGQHPGVEIAFPQAGVYQVTVKAENEPAALPQTIKLLVKGKEVGKPPSKPITSKRSP